MMLLEGRRAVVTGGSRGIGYEISKIFLEHGAHVLAVSRSSTKLADARLVLPRLSTLSADVSDVADVERVTAWVAKEWNVLDILVNNAGVWFGDEFDLTGGDDQGLMTSLRINVEAAYLCTKRLLPLLLASDDPRIVNVGSTSGIFGPNLKTAYGVSKAALHALTIATAHELYGRAAVNGLSPGWVKTDMAPDAPRHPRWSAEGALSIVTQPAAVTGKLFHGTRMRSWTARFPRA